MSSVVVDGGEKWSTVAQHGDERTRRAFEHESERGGGAEMFLGTHYPKLDDKGRLFLPAKFREQLQGGLVMTKGHEHCIFVFPRDAFMGYAERMQSAPLSSKDARDYMRVLLSAASDEIPDRQGRVTIPATLRTYAGLNKECVVIGAGSRVEIWDGAQWDRYMENSEPAYADLSEEVVPGLM